MPTSYVWLRPINQGIAHAFADETNRTTACNQVIPAEFELLPSGPQIRHCLKCQDVLAQG